MNSNNNNLQQILLRTVKSLETGWLYLEKWLLILLQFHEHADCVGVWMSYSNYLKSNYGQKWIFCVRIQASESFLLFISNGQAVQFWNCNGMGWALKLLKWWNFFRFLRVNKLQPDPRVLICKCNFIVVDLSGYGILLNSSRIICAFMWKVTKLVYCLIFMEEQWTTLMFVVFIHFE